MPEHALIIAIRLLDGRYHGARDWPPGPFRLFQALVAAAHTGRTPTENELAALRWLEQLAPPVIAAPTARAYDTATTYYVPRNGGDTTGGNLARAAQKRDPKHSKPILFDPAQPFLYLWTFTEGNDHAATLATLAERLYQFGRSVDMAFADAVKPELLKD